MNFLNRLADLMIQRVYRIDLAVAYVAFTLSELFTVALSTTKAGGYVSLGMVLALNGAVILMIAKGRVSNVKMICFFCGLAAFIFTLLHLPFAGLWPWPLLLMTGGIVFLLLKKRTLQLV